MSDQRTSRETVRPVSKGQARHFGRMVENWCLKYLAGSAMLEQIKGNADIKQSFYNWLDEFAFSHKFSYKFANPSSFFWKTTTIGGMSLGQLKAVLREHCVDASNPIANAMMHSNAFEAALRAHATPGTIDLFLATVLELGLEDGATTKRIFGRLHELGCERLTSIVAPWILLGADRDTRFLASVYMEPIVVEGLQRLFTVGNGVRGLVLYDDQALPDSRWDGDRRILFHLPRSH